MAGYPETGESFGRYLIQRRIGKGGMGVVFAATQVDLGREVALKVLSPDLAEDPEFRKRFAREATALAALDSPHVIHVYEHGEHNGSLFIATQLISGGDLATLMSAVGGLPAATALELVGQVASAVADVHAVGLLHRDIKPSNVLVRQGGRGTFAYLCDFGIARSLDAGYTRTAGVMGTLGYMAPERHQGADATAASDIYSLGCLLWASLTGHPPFSGTSEYQVMVGHIEQDIPLWGGAEPPAGEINQILRRAMAKDPADRYPSAELMHTDLVRAGRMAAPVDPREVPVADTVILTAEDTVVPTDRSPGDAAITLMRSVAEPVSDPPVVESPTAPLPCPEEADEETVAVAPPVKRARRRRAAVAIVAIAAIAGVVAAVTFQHDPTSPSPQATPAPSTAGDIYVTSVGANSVWVFAPNGTLLRSIEVGDTPTAVAVAPDGTPNAGTAYVANSDSDSVSVIGADGPLLSTVVDGRHPCGVAVAPSGTPNEGTVYVANSRSGSVSVISPDGSVLGAVPVGRRPCGIAVAPAGTPQAGTVYVANSGSVSVIGPDGRKRSTIRAGNDPGALAVAPAGTPNAGTVYVPSTASGSISVIDPDGSLLPPISVGNNPGGVAVAPRGASNAGTLYVTDLGSGSLLVIGPDGQMLSSIQVGRSPSGVAVAPEGTPNAGTVYVTNNGSTSVSVIGPDGEVRATSFEIDTPVGVAVAG